MKCKKQAASCELQAASIKRREVQRLFIGILLTLILSSFSVSAQKENEAIKQGNDAYRKNDFEIAQKKYATALAEDDKNIIAKFNMANTLQHTNDLDKSANLYDDIIKNTTDAGLQSKAYYNKALALMQQNKMNDAIDAFKQSLRLQPADSDTRENLQKALQEKQQQQPQPQPNKKQQKQNQKQQKQQQMNQQMMEQKFKELEDQEKQLQKDLQKQKTNTPDNEKDW